MIINIATNNDTLPFKLGTFDFPFGILNIVDTFAMTVF